MTTLKRVEGTDLFVPKSVNEVSIRFLCSPFDLALGDEVQLEDIWPNLQLLYWSLPLRAEGEAFGQALARVAHHLDIGNTEKRIGFVQGAEGTGRTDWIKMAEVNGSPGGFNLSDTFEITVDGGRYRVTLFKGASVGLADNQLTIEAPDDPPIFEYLMTDSSNDSDLVEIEGEVVLDLSNHGGTFKFPIALDENKVTYFGLENRVSEIESNGGVGGVATINSTRYIPVLGPGLGSGNPQPLDLVAHIDPLNAYDRERSYLDIPVGTLVQLNLTSADGNVVEMFATEHTIPEHMGESGKLRGPRFFFSRQSVTLDSDSGLPLKDWQSFELDGAFSPAGSGVAPASAGETEPMQLLTGLSDTETMRVSDNQRLVFRSGGPAFLPTREFTRNDGRSPEGATLSHPPMLQDELTMSWVGVESEEAVAETRIVSEGANTRLLALNTDGNTLAEAGADNNAIRLRHSPLELKPTARSSTVPTTSIPDSLGHMLPILPFVGRPVDVDMPNAKEVDLERRVIQPMRRRALTPAPTISVASQDIEEIRTTPSGLRVVVKGGLITKLFLTRSDSAVTLYIENIPHELADALMRDQLFLVINTLPKLGELQPTLGGSINIGGWTLNLQLKSPVAVDPAGTDPEEKPAFLIIKDDDRPLKELIQNEDLWAGHDVAEGGNPFVDDIEATKTALKKHFNGLLKRRKTAVKEAKPAYDRAAAIWDHSHAKPSDTGWRGVLMTNPVVNLGELPDQLAALAAGLSNKEVHADFLGIDLNRLEQSGGQLDIRVSPVFGLVDYNNETAQKAVKEGDSFFNMELERLVVRFENGSVQDFYAKLLLLFRSFLDQPVLEEGETEAGKILAIEGSRESRNSDGKKLDVYTFQNRQEWLHKFKGEDSLVEQATMSRVAYSTNKTKQESETAKSVESGFSVTGKILFNKNFPPGLPLFDLDEINYKELNIDVFFDILAGKVENLKFAFRPNNFSLDFKSSQKKKGGLFAKLPFKPVGFEWWKSGASLDDLGFFGFGLDPGGKDLLASTFKYGIRFDLDLGSLGNLGRKLKDFKLSALLGWRQKEDKNGNPLGKTQFSLGFKLEGNGGDGLDIGIGNILGIRADRYDIKKQPDGSAYFIYAVNAKLMILGETFPEDSKLNLFMFVDPDEAKLSSMGWLAVFHNSSGGKIIDLQTLAAGQRIDPFSGGTLGDRPSVKKLMDAIVEMGKDADGKSLNRDEPKIDPVLKLLKDGKIRYKPDGAWTVGLRSTLFETFDLDFVLRDPDLYGLRVAYGELFSIDVAYRKLTEELGVYSTEILVPESIRSFEMGAASFTIGVIGLEVFTDGGVSVDFGYPANRDFERAFSVEVLPFTGSGGFRVSRVSGAGSRMIPTLRADNVFNYEPVTEVALGGRFGLGKSFRKGPLRAELSVTFYAYLAGAQGVLRQKPGTTNPVQRPRSTYVVLAGTVGVMGEILGFVDFGIVKAGVAIRVYAEAGLVFETDRATLLYMEAGVSVRCVVVVGRIKIFGKKIEIKVSFSFSTKLRYNWQLGSTRADYQEIYNRDNIVPALASSSVAEMAASTDTDQLDWETAPLPMPKHWRTDGEEEPLNLNLSLVPDMTFARYVDDKGDLTIHPEAVLLLTAPIRNPAEVETAPETPTPYEQLIRAMVFWAVAVHRGLLKDEVEYSPLDELISINDLIELERRLTGSDEQLGSPGDGRNQYKRTPLYRQLTEFLKRNFHVRIGLLDDAETRPLEKRREEHAFFPMPEDIEIKRVGFDSGAQSTKLWETGLVDEKYRVLIDQTFSRLVEETAPNSASPADTSGEQASDAVSLASVIFEEHLGVLIRMGVDQLLQLMQDRYASGADDGGSVADKQLPLRTALDLLIQRRPDEEGAKEHRLPLCETALFAGRFFMHGLNLPKPDLDLNAKVPDPLLDLVNGVDEETRGKGLPLFRLASLQQPLFAGEKLEDGKDYGFSLAPNPTADWLKVDRALTLTGSGLGASAMRPPVKLSRSDYDTAVATQTKVESFANELELDTGLMVTAHRNETLPLGSRIDLVSREGDTLVSQRALWRLPTNLLAGPKIGASEGGRQGRGDLRLKVRQRLNRGPNAKVHEIPALEGDRTGGRCWSIVVELRIQQIMSLPPVTDMRDGLAEGTPAEPLKNIYQIGGVDEDVRRLLDSLIMAAFPPEGAAASIREDQLDLSLYALAPPSESGGYGAYERVDNAGAEDDSGMRLVQINLSAEPRPEISSFSLAATEEGNELVHADTKQSLQFIELIRRAAIVNSGGFFLHTDSQAVERLFAPAAEDQPRKGERSDPFLLLVVDVDPDVVDVEQPAVITNAVTAPASALTDAPRMDQPDGDGNENSELDWDAAFLETGSALHEPLYPAGVVPLRFKLPDPDTAAESDAVADMCTRFTLLDYAVVRDDASGENIWVRDSGGLGYHETLPVGATDSAENLDGDLLPTGTPSLLFELNIPVGRLSHAAGVEDPSPYDSVGKPLSVRYRLRDIYGNSIGVEKTLPPQNIQFVDRLQRISDLPLLSVDWRPDGAFVGSGGVILRLRLGGSALARPTQEGGQPTNSDDHKKRAEEYARAYRLARHQLLAPHSTLELLTSLNDGAPLAIENDQLNKLSEFFRSCADKLEELAEDPGLPPDDGVDPCEDPRNLCTEIGFRLAGGAPEDGNSEDVFVEVGVRLVQRRDPAFVAAHERLDQGTDPMVRVEMPIQPTYLAESSDQDKYLDTFAKNLEALVEGFVVAVGAKRNAGSGQQALWLVPKEVLAVSMPDDFHHNGPASYAIRPLSTRLESFSWDEFPRYDLPPEGRENGKLQLVDKDMDDLGRTMVRRIDEALSPEMVKAMLEQAPEQASVYIRDLLSVKDTLADFFADLVAPILERDDENSGGRATQGLAEKIGRVTGSPLQDRLKRRLSAAYELDTVLAFPLAFDESKDEEEGLPLLFGEVTYESVDGDSDAKKSFSYDTSVIQAQHKSPALISMVDVFELVPADVYEHSLTYTITQVQRIPWPSRDDWKGFAELSSEKRYRNTAWLRLVTPQKIRTSGGYALQGQNIEIPVVLRDFPSQPTIRFATNGTWEGNLSEGPLKELVCAVRSWDYELGWDWDNALQDELRVTVDYNQLHLQQKQTDSGTRATDFKNLRAIARFVIATDELWPGVSAFVRDVGGIDDPKRYLDEFMFEALMLKSVIQERAVTLASEELNHAQDSALIVRGAEDILEIKEQNLEAAKTVEARVTQASPHEGSSVFYPEIEFKGIDIIRYRSAWAKLDLERNASFGVADLPARPDFVYRVGGIRTGDPLVPRNDIADDLNVIPAAGATLMSALEDFFVTLLDTNACLADGRVSAALSIEDQVSLEVECCYLSGKLDAYFEGLAPGQRQPGAEMGKLANLRADPKTCAAETMNLVQTWLNARSVPTSDDDGWQGKLRMQVALFQEGGGEDGAAISDRPFLLIRRCILPLAELKRV